MRWNKDRGCPPSDAAVEDNQLRADFSRKIKERSGFGGGESLPLSSERIFIKNTLEKRRKMGY